MSTSPTFILDLASLKSSLRLSGPNASDTETMLEDAVRKARLLFHDRLGSARVTTLKAIVRVDDPTTPDQMLREKAELCELAMIRRECLQTMPVWTFDPGRQTEVWNQDGLMRNMTKKERDAAVESLSSDIEKWLSELGLEDKSVGGFAAMTIGGSDVNPPPGQFVWDDPTVPDGYRRSFL